MKTCATCEFWTVFPENNLAGHCAILGALLIPKVDRIEKLITPATEDEDAKLQAELAITSSGHFGERLTTQVVAVRTQRGFGCIFHKTPEDFPRLFKL